MTEPVFVDTNVLVYARDLSEPSKQPGAQRWMTHLWQSRTGRLSFQILQEFYVTVTRKLEPGLEPQKARSDVRALLAWRPSAVDHRVLESAWAIQDRYQLSWWDALIVGAAQVIGCRYLLTEDLQHGLRIGELEIVDPFRCAPDEIGT